MPPEIISRADAVALGLTRYYTGVACKHNHVAERYTSTTGCLECLHPTRTKRSLSHLDHKVARTSYTLNVDKRLGQDMLLLLPAYLQQCLDAYVESVELRLFMWCPDCDGAGKTLHKDHPRIRPCTRCERTGMLDPTPMLANLKK